MPTWRLAWLVPAVILLSRPAWAASWCAIVETAGSDRTLVESVTALLERHGIAAHTDAIDPGAVSGRARGRALLEYTHRHNAGLLVMGAYGRNQALSFLGLGGATSKVISACRAPRLPFAA